MSDRRRVSVSTKDLSLRSFCDSCYRVLTRLKKDGVFRDNRMYLSRGPEGPKIRISSDSHIRLERKRRPPLVLCFRCFALYTHHESGWEEHFISNAKA